MTISVKGYIISLKRMEVIKLSREIDNIVKRNKYKEEKFGDKKSRKDDYTGERIFNGNSKDSIKKHSVDKVSDTDHITPIKTVQNRYKGLTKEQQRTLANNEHNYAITNAKLNRSKGGLENHEFLMRQHLKGEKQNLKTSAKMLEKEAESRVVMRTQATVMYTENVVHKICDIDVKEKINSINQAGKEEAINSAIFASAISVTTNAISVIRGEKDCQDAINNTLKDIVTATAVGYMTGAAMKQMALEHTEASLFVNGSIQIAKQLVSLASGEITTDDFLTKTAETTAYISAGYIGKCIGGSIGEILIPIPVIGAYIGQYIGEVVTTLVCSEIINTIRFSKEFEKQNSRIISLYKRAESEIRKSQTRLEYIINKENNGLIEKISEGFDNIVEGIKDNSYDSIKNGIMIIGNEFDLSENDFNDGLITKENIFVNTDENIILE